MRQYSNHYLPVTFCIIAASALFLVSGCVRSPFKTLKLPDGSTIEYVEVRDEPDHRQQFENASARLYEVVILPGKTTLYHRHSQNTIYLTVSPTKISSRLAGSEQVDELEFLQGAVSFNPQRDNPFNHVVSNIGQLNAHFVGVELYDTGRTFDRLPMESPYYTLEIENPHIRVYRLKLAPGESTGSVNYPFSGFTISLNSGQLKIETDNMESDVLEFAPADWRWHDGPVEQVLTNAGDELFETVVYLIP
jgi:hypothetical protein